MTSKQVQYRDLDNQRPSQEQEYSSLYYRGFLFIRVASFTHNQFQRAVDKSRQFLDQNEPVAAIVLKEIDRITVWAEAEKIN
ncbi:MAG: hypothetical protein ACFBSE_06580 [Prochloraceae cyanobacterium]